MKNILKFIFTFITVVTLSSIVYSNSLASSEKAANIDNYSLNSVECKYDQCHAIAKSTEERCKHCVSNDGDLYCWQHDD